MRFGGWWFKWCVCLWTLCHGVLYQRLGISHIRSGTIIYWRVRDVCNAVFRNQKDKKAHLLYLLYPELVYQGRPKRCGNLNVVVITEHTVHLRVNFLAENVRPRPSEKKHFANRHMLCALKFRVVRRICKSAVSFYGMCSLYSAHTRRRRDEPPEPRDRAPNINLYYIVHIQSTTTHPNVFSCRWC